MLNKIKQFFEENISPDNQEDIEHRLKLATGALLIEIMQQDGETKDEEVEAIKHALKTKFELSASETNALFVLAHEEAKEAVDLYQFTSLINKHFSVDKKIKVVEYLWVIAYADNHLDAHEEHIVRRVADLLYITHQDFIKAKHRVLENK